MQLRKHWWKRIQRYLLHCQYTKEIREKLKIIRTSFVNRHGPIPLHDKAGPRALYKTIAKLNELKYDILQNPSSSLYLSPIDLHFVKHLQQCLRAEQFENEDTESVKFHIRFY
ncbi:hypothetical protein TNCV_4581681 [Trichonephila clavipes]|nr:hypothetical protein TNCV_4581681 [Trichonephila clavipes]